MSIKQIVVTGGAGFIGSHVCQRLLANGHSVICVDNFYSGQRKHTTRLAQHDNFRLVEHNIVEPLYLDDPIAAIYHLACPASPVAYQKNPIFTVKTNVIGTINMLGLARAHNARLLLASTSEVYGNPQEHPQRESYRGSVNSLGPRACYDEGKRCAETLCMDYHREHSVDVCIARIFNTYGPHMAIDDGRVISNFIVQALKGEDITLYGDGTQTRSFQYVDDLVTGLLLLMEHDSFVGPVNLGNPNEQHTIKALAEHVLKQTSSSSKLIHKALPQDDPVRRQPDIRLAKEKLSWSPHVTLEDGLTKTIAYFKERL